MLETKYESKEYLGNTLPTLLLGDTYTEPDNCIPFPVQLTAPELGSSGWNVKGSKAFVVVVQSFGRTFTLNRIILRLNDLSE